MIVRHRIYTSVPSILEILELLVIHNRPCRHSSKLQLSIWSHSGCLNVQQDWYPMYYPEGMKARVSLVQSIKPRRLPGPQSSLRVVQPLHTISFISFRFNPLAFFLFVMHHIFTAIHSWHGRWFSRLSWHFSSSIVLEWIEAWKFIHSGLFVLSYLTGGG